MSFEFQVSGHGGGSASGAPLASGVLSTLTDAEIDLSVLHARGNSGFLGPSNMSLALASWSAGLGGTSSQRSM